MNKWPRMLDTREFIKADLHECRQSGFYEWEMKRRQAMEVEAAAKFNSLDSSDLKLKMLGAF
jgi:hypothetical protein